VATALTEHFNLEEFQSHDGAPFPPEVVENLKKTALMLEWVRAAVGTPLFINSGYRSPAWNAKIGGEPNSYHIKGMAADIVSKTKTPAEVQAVCKRLQEQGVVGGLGSYAGFTHVDWGPKRSWSL
jgi:uncharacterized protein YcbK (DUF882 family)